MGETSQLNHGRLARQLIPIFIAWKTTLLLLAVLAPGPGYDTSSLILLNSSTDRHVEVQSPSVVDRLTLNTFRWDALYFVKSAQRGYVYEQEWAFSRAYSYIMNAAARCEPRLIHISQSYTNATIGLSGRSEPSLRSHIWAGIAISNVCHLISVLVLFRLLNIALGPKQNARVPFIASVLHILSPAALFLSSPYAEALFSAFNFAGMLHYVLARSTENSMQAWTITQDAYMLGSGVLFASATLIRGNGLLSGLIYLYDVASFVPRISTLQLTRHEIRRLFVTCVAGIMIAVGFAGPQYLAYQEYCMTNNSSTGVRSWCDKRVPSIYTWVQSHYW
jgi:phosphatidylinositol glycan class V